MKKILIADDFYSNFEMWETEKPEGLKTYAALMAAGECIDLDPAIYHLIGSQDDIETQEALDMADEIIFTSDF